MVKKLLTLLLALLPAAVLSAQDKIIVPEGYVLVDSLVYRPAASVDSTLNGKSIFSILPSAERGDDADVKVHQSQSIAAAFNQRISQNKSRSITGYRVRIFYDNKQNSRGASEYAASRFRGMYPGVAVYRSFANPFFRVVVGDFRTRSEAMQCLEAIKGAFPSAFIIKEKINYPVVDKQHSYVVDTAYVLRPKAAASL